MILGLTGKKQSGKTTAAKHLETRLPFAARINFKDALIDEIVANFPKLNQAIIDAVEKANYDGFPWTVERLVKEKPPLFRALLQNYGTEVRRGDEPDYWVRRWTDRASSLEQHVICDDVRFINEAQAVRDLGGIIVRVERTDVEDADDHSSERQMDELEPDYTISVKTGEHDKLYAFLDFLIENNVSTQPVTLESHGETNNIR